MPLVNITLAVRNWSHSRNYVGGSLTHPWSFLGACFKLSTANNKPTNRALIHEGLRFPSWACLINTDVVTIERRILSQQIPPLENSFVSISSTTENVQWLVCFLKFKNVDSCWLPDQILTSNEGPEVYLSRIWVVWSCFAILYSTIFHGKVAHKNYYL